MTVKQQDNEQARYRWNERHLPEETSDETSSYTSSDDSDPSDTDQEDEDDEDEEEEEEDELSCNVCDRSFPSSRLLSRHQLRKRHFGCSVCDACFPDLRALERHKEALEHWSEDEGNTYESDSDSEQEVAPSADDEMERLL